MKTLSALIGVFLCFEIFSQQTAGAGSFTHKCGSSYSYCYIISDEKANWDTANAACVLQGGELINHANSWVNQNVQANNRGEYYWTGYRRVGDTSVFQSTDGSTISDYNSDWKDTTGVDCVGIDGESGRYLSLECNTNNTVVCQIEGEKCYARIQQQYRDICSSPVFSSGIPTESSLRNLTLNFSVPTGDIINFYDYSQVIVITQLRANTQTQIPLDYYNTILQIGTDRFQENVTVAIHKTQKNVQVANDSFIKRKDIITIYSSSNSPVTVQIEFISYYYNGDEQCMYQGPDGKWSSDGLDVSFCRLNRIIQCNTKLQNIGTFKLKAKQNSSWESDRGLYSFNLNPLYSLLGIVAFISIVSVLLLVSSVIIFIVSGKKFFSHDINILHLNNTLSLFLAIISLPVIYPGVNTSLESVVYKATPECFAITFFLQFLWTNVFLSSLSIAIVVFYTIWVVSINHTARKLYKYLIPIGWGVSLVWAVIATVIKTQTVSYCDSKVLCLVNGDYKFYFDWSLFGLMIVILLINTTLLILSLVKIWSVLRKQNSQEGELKRLRRVAIGGILLIPALGLPFISLMAIQLFASPKIDNEVNLENYVRANLIVLLINSPIGIVHFLFITCQIKETILRKYCCCCRRITPAQIAHSLHLNIARKSPKAKQETPNDAIPDPVPMNEFIVSPLDSIRLVN